MRSLIVIVFFFTLFFCSPLYFGNTSTPSITDNSFNSTESTVPVQSKDCQKEISLLNDQLITLTNQLKMARREIAILHQAKEKPGWPEIVGGIGIILGLFGIVSFIISRNSLRKFK